MPGPARAVRDCHWQSAATASAEPRRPGPHQQIGVTLLAIIGFTPLLLAIIDFYCIYWLLLAIIFLHKVFILLAIIEPSSNIYYSDYCDTIIAIIGSASNYVHYLRLLTLYQLLALQQIN
jgi:hypothetical protein